MRVFVSIDIPKKVKEEILKIQEKLPEFKGKKTEQENLHLTLKFLGEINDKKVEQVKERLKQIKFKSFVTEIDSIGVFSPKFIKIVWLHLTNCEKLQKEIDEALAGLFEKEKRFMSHLTIARVKKVDNKNLFLKELKKIKVPNLRFKVDSFYLMESKLSKKGSKYSVIDEYKLN